MSRFVRCLHPHRVDTAAERGWSRLENGDLIQKAEDEGYEALVTIIKGSSECSGTKLRLHPAILRKKIKENTKARKAILNAVEEQLQSPESPYVKEHYDRLLAEGVKKSEAKRMLGALLAVEMWEMVKFQRNFDKESYIEKLSKLPDESYLDD